MKRVAVLLSLLAAAPGAAWAQVPTTGPATTPGAPNPAPAAPVAAPAPPPGADPAADAAGAPDAAPAPPAPPGDQYYVDKPPAGPAPFEPSPPGERRTYEPPPPPQVEHLAPRMALWLGARLGWFFPFGNAWSRAVPRGSDGDQYYYELEGRPWSDYATSGPLLELDAGVRLSRSYMVFLLWERAQTGSGNLEGGVDGAQDGGDSDFWGVGLRASSDPDRLGFVTEVAIGYRRARTFFENGAEYQFTDAPFEARLGLGGEYRVNRFTSFSLLGTVGVGGFGKLERVAPSGNVSPLTNDYDEGDGHGWATLNLAAHFDLLGSKK